MCVIQATGVVKISQTKKLEMKEIERSYVEML